MVRVRVRDFQSVEDAEIVVDGFTVVTGQNNSGKTAVMRAVQGVFTNPPGNAFVRRGADQFTVEVDFGGGDTVVWEKGAKVKPRYTVRGKAIASGRAVPDEVLSLGIRPVQAGTGTVWPQFAPQFTGQVFLLDLPGSALAEAVADVERVGQLTRALRFAESDKRSSSDALKLRKQDASNLRDEFGRFAGLDDVAEAVRDVEASAKLADEVAGELARVATLRESLRAALGGVQRLQGVASVRIPSAEEASQARALLRDVVALRVSLAAASRSVLALAGFSRVPVPPVPVEAAELTASLRDLRALQKRLREARARTVPEVAIRTALDAWRAVDVEGPLAKARKASQVLATLRGLRASLDAARERVRVEARALEVKRDEFRVASEEAATLLKGVDVCPTCGSTVGHAHG